MRRLEAEKKRKEKKHRIRHIVGMVFGKVGDSEEEGHLSYSYWGSKWRSKWTCEEKKS